jgi:hypothetical protein
MAAVGRRYAGNPIRLLQLWARMYTVLESLDERRNKLRYGSLGFLSGRNQASEFYQAEVYRISQAFKQNLRDLKGA